MDKRREPLSAGKVYHRRARRGYQKRLNQPGHIQRIFLRGFTLVEIIAGESPGAFRAPGRVLLPAVRAVAGTGADAFLTEEKTD